MPVRPAEWLERWGTKSVSAALIEGSVVELLRTAIVDEQTPEQLRIGNADLEAFEHIPVGLIRAVVKDVSFDGKTGAVLRTITQMSLCQLHNPIVARTVVLSPMILHS